MNWISKIKSAIASVGDYVEQHNKSVVESHIALFEKILRRSSLSCGSCNNLAIPILGTKNIYKCKSCGRKFTQSNHSIESVLVASIMDNHRSKDEKYIDYVYEMAIEHI